MKHRNISENNFEQCTKCTICTVYCPLLEVNPLYPGPKQAGPDGERYRLREPIYYDEAINYCLNCKRCELSCPSGVRIGDIITLARVKNNRLRRAPLRDRLLGDVDTIGSVASYAADVVNSTLRAEWVRSVLDSTLKIDRRSIIPPYTSYRFRTWYRREAQAEQQGYDRHIAYFHGPHVNYHSPELGRALLRVFNAVGFGVRLIEQERGGTMSKMESGLLRSARRDASLNLVGIRRVLAEGAPKVVTTSPTVAYTLRESYGNIFSLEADDIKQSITLATRFIYRLLERGDLKLAFRSDYHRRVVYHASCYMERLGWSIYSTSLLRLIPGLEMTMLPSQCCGRAGNYALKRENYNFSEAIGRPLFDAVERSGAEVVVTDCESCREQIGAHTSARTMHPIEILAEALDFERTRELNKR